MKRNNQRREKAGKLGVTDSIKLSERRVWLNADSFARYTLYIYTVIHFVNDRVQRPLLNARFNVNTHNTRHLTPRSKVVEASVSPTDVRLEPILSTAWLMNIRSTYLPRKYSLPQPSRWKVIRFSRLIDGIFISICKYFIFVSDMGRCHDKFVMLYVSRYQSPPRKFVSIFFQIDEEFTLRINLLSPLDERNASKMHRKWILSPFRKVSKYYQNISELKNFNLSEIQIFFREREREKGEKHAIPFSFVSKLV